MIPQETIERIRDESDVAQIIGEYVRLKKRGRNFEALCPFHQEKTPSFKVSADKQIYHCFGCGKGGNVYTFLMEHEKMTFVEAVRHLAQKANIPIREEVTDVRREHLEKLNFAHTVAVQYFRETLKQSKYRMVLNDYLKTKRGISDESIELFKLGLCGESWDGLIQYASRKGFKPPELEQAGLALKSEKRGTYFDRFRQRLMIPIFNLSGRPIAFGGRTLKKGEPAKYVNSPETPLYNKSNVLYGLNFSKDEIREQNCVIVVEGYFDVISLWQAGVRNVVASSGTAFTPQQARLLARFCERVYLFFDADSAGQTAALRSVDALFDAGLEVSVIVPPEGEDPDSIAQQYGRDKIEELQHEALDYIPYRVRNVDIGETGIIGKEKLVKELGQLGAKITDPTRRSLFFQEAADVLRVDTSLFAAARASAKDQQTETVRPVRQNKIEFEFLSLLINNRGPMEKIFQTISPEDFDSKAYSRMFTHFSTQYEIEGALDARRMIEHFHEDEESVSLLSELAAVDWETERIPSEIKARTDDFAKRKQKRIRSKLKKDLEQAEASEDHQKAAEILEQLKQYGLSEK
jgi:DNA primase